MFFHGHVFYFSGNTLLFAPVILVYMEKLAHSLCVTSVSEHLAAHPLL